MSDKTIVRSGKDRLRYAIAFEMLLMAFLVPIGAIVFDKPFETVGVLGFALAVKAMALNLVYNWVIDQIEARKGRISSQRSHLGRMFHAVGFEAALVSTSLPLYVWWLEITLFQALTADILVTTFVVAYTYVFTLAYDKIFPLTQPPCPAQS